MRIDQLVIENIDWLYKKAQRFYSDRFDIDDLVSDTVEKILTSRERFDNRKAFRPWALTVMRNTFITMYNRSKCVPFVGMERDYSYASELTADRYLAVSHILSTVRECARKSVAIECVILYAKGYTYAEISQMLGVPKGTVMSRISNGRKMLREALG